MEDKFLNKRYISLDGNYRLYMNHDGVFKEVAPFLLRRRKISSDKLFYRLEDLPHSYRVKFEDMAISASELVGAKGKDTCNSKKNRTGSGCYKKCCPENL